MMRHPLVVELPHDELGGASGARLFHVLALGKYNSPEYPYTVANEKIASDVGRALGLRVPEVQSYRFRNQWHAFQHYLERTESEETMPPGTSREVAAYFESSPELLHGMFCFDLLVCNNDRRPENLLLANDGHVWLIDHGNALFYRPSQGQPAGVARLNRIQKNLKVLFDKPHHFLRAVQSWELIENWCDRIAALPDYLMEFFIETLPEGILTAEERESLTQFLNRRKHEMKGLIVRNRELFPSLEMGGV